MAKDADPETLARMTPTRLAAFIRSSGGSATEEGILRHIEDGAPVNPDGTMNAAAYAAWLFRRLGERGG